MDTGIDAAARVIRKFLEDRYRRVIKEQAKTEVKPEELKDTEFGDLNLWRLDRLITKIKKES